MIEQSLYTALSTFSPLIALVGSKVYPLAAEQETSRPYVIYQKVSNPNEETHDGGVTYETRFQLDVWADTYVSAKQTAGQVKAAMSAWKIPGELVPKLVDDQDDYEQETGLFRVILDYIVWNKEG